MQSKSAVATTELDVKLKRIRSLLLQSELDALLLNRVDNFAWATCGASSYVSTADSYGVASLLITSTHRYVLTNNIEAPRLMQEEGLNDQGWEFRISPWYEDQSHSDLLAGMRLGVDGPSLTGNDVSAEVARLRTQLTLEEGIRFRALGALCAEGMRQAVDAVRPGMTEYEIAGLLADAVESRGVQAVVNLVSVDERLSSFRHPLPTSRRLQHYAMLIICGRKWGLICSLTRLVYFGTLPEEIRRKALAVARIDAVAIEATRPGKTIGEVFHQIQAAYDAAGFPNEWQMHHQGGSAGYAPREVTAGPGSEELILAGQAFAWNPSIAGAKSEDTILVGEQSNEIMTEVENWPFIEVEIAGKKIKRPAILEMG